MKSMSFAGFASILSACLRNKSLPIFTGIIFLTTLVTGCGGGEGSSHSTDNGVYVFWDAPATREDGSPLALSEIASYRVYHSFTPAEPTSSDKSIKDDKWSSIQMSATADSYYFDNLKPGEHYFAVTVVDTDGIESEPSEILPKTVR
ncbi:fibronectin type III domain-containing protein [Hahella aquimaris]|uniref:fibronectin type III domain-containing protein n=1 Tax=Hahella sp. HNIBRBA332 TaxID=3015983 RepID=UPI00273B2FBA|nr:fibronectin type III domain-containing protein [Hahella sp. HNIBRBA332]WLQ15253.1 fibronectin type III domain-containing protein [Hahella sp. HNIBRBA332]